MIVRTSNLFLLIVTACSCNRNADLHQLVLRDNAYYLPGKSDKFSGRATTKLPNGKTSNIVNFRDGIPYGQWMAFGYEGEIIQDGSYRVVVPSEDDGLDRSIVRLNVHTMLEGDYREKEVLVIVRERPRLDSAKVRENVKDYLAKHRDLLQSDSAHCIQILEGELQKWQ